MKSINVELETTFTYANGSGEPIECSFIELKEPTGKVSATCCAIEALIKEKIIQLSNSLDDETVDRIKEKPVSEEDEGFEGVDDAEFYAVCVASGVDMSKLVLYCRELFKHVALMGGEKKLTTPRMNEMTHSDFKKLIGAYLANFIMR